MKFRSLIALLGIFGVLSGSAVYAQKESTTTKPSTPKKMPMRDPKTGKFMKKSDTAKSAATTTTKKKMPMRDPKTGKFIKASGATASGAKTTASTGKMTPKSGKMTPMRDPKTGRFIKKQ